MITNAKAKITTNNKEYSIYVVEQKQTHNRWVNAMFNTIDYSDILVSLALKDSYAASIFLYLLKKCDRKSPFVSAAQVEIGVKTGKTADRVSRSMKVLLEFEPTLVTKVSKNTYAINLEYIWTMSMLERNRWIVYINKFGYGKALEVYKANQIKEEFDNFFEHLNNQPAD